MKNTNQDFWFYTVEKSRHNATYHVTMRPTHSWTGDQLQCSLRQWVENGTIVSVRVGSTTTFCSRFPSRLKSSGAVFQATKDMIYLRLVAECGLDNAGPALTSLEAINDVCCRACGHPFISSVNGIEKIYPLANADWGEIADCLSCVDSVSRQAFAAVFTSAFPDELDS